MTDNNLHFKKMRILAGILAVSVVAFALASCEQRTGKSVAGTVESPAVIYRNYLVEIRKLDKLSSAELAGHISRWQTVKDSVFTRIRRDTIQYPHSTIAKECILLHDSIRAEFGRLSKSQPRTYKEVLLLREQFSPHVGDTDLKQATEEIRPFFNHLDKRHAYQSGKRQILSAYRTLLSGILKDGIHGTDDLKRFVEKEDALFRAFIASRHDWGEESLADITRDTEKCCALVFKAAGQNEISYKEAIVYMAMRANRRVIQSTEIALEDALHGEITTPNQVHAHIWTLIQPYVSLDGCCIAVLSEHEKESLYRIAEKTPGAYRILKEVLHTETGRLDELPGMLMEIFVTSL